MVQRRKIGVSVPASSGMASLGDMRLQPNYSLNSIQPNPTNPRAPDLRRHKINLDMVKKVMRRETETLDAFQERMETWIETTNELPNEAARDAWYALLYLSIDVAVNGLLQPITVRLKETAGGNAEIVAGERRFLASWLSACTTIHAIVRSQTDDQASVLSLTENTQRYDLSLAAVIRHLIVQQSDREIPYTVTEVSRLAAVSRGSAAAIHQALNLPLDHPVHAGLLDGSISRPHHIQKAIEAEKPKPPRSAVSQPTEKPAPPPATDRSGPGVEVEESDPPTAPAAPVSTAKAEKSQAAPSTRAEPVTHAKSSQEPVTEKSADLEALRTWLDEGFRSVLKLDAEDYEALAPYLDRLDSPSSMDAIRAALDDVLTQVAKAS